MNDIQKFVEENARKLNVIAFDPGETTGIAIFKEGKYHSSKELNYLEILKYVRERTAYHNYIFVIEQFRVYAHKANTLINNDLIPSQVIGELCGEARWQEIPVVLQSASQAKGFFTDAKLKALNLWPKSRHERDAIRLGLHYLCFGKD